MIQTPWRRVPTCIPSAKALLHKAHKGRLFLTLLLMLLTTTLWAQSVSYIDADGKSKSCTSYTVIDGSHTSYSAAGWYVVQGNVSTSRIEFTNNGDVHLILCDGATLTLSDHIEPYGSMTIYGQSGGTGTLRIGTEASPSTYTYGAIRTDNGTLTINGGKIYAYGNNYAIRSPYYASIIINGGTLTAKGPDAIELDYGSATINGGTVNLSSTNHDAISTGGGINITGGTVNANGNRYGLFTTGGNISITGGKVTASGGNSYGALLLLNGSLTLGCSHQDDSYLLGNIYNHCTVVLANNFKINGASSTYGKAGTYDDEYFNNHLQNKTLTPDGLCVAPSSVSVSNVTMTAATLSWTENGTSTNWVLQYSTSNTFATATSVNVSNTPSKTITGLTAQTTYYCRVKAVNGNSESSWSSVVQFTTPDELNLAGQGTKDNPYLISSVNDWNKFATNVNNGVTYSDKYIKLTASISVSQMVGTSSANSFQGHFDGGDNTLTVSYGSSTAPIAEDNVAPFRYAGTTSNKTCEIKNLHVTGTIYTSKKYAAGFVGQSNSGGQLTFTNCRSSITINSSTNGDGTHGGFVGVCNSSYILEFNGCVFDGKLLGENTTCCGGFVGWRNAGTVRFYQSIFAPSQINVSTTGSATFCRNADSNTLFRRAYYTQTMNTEQGKLMHSITSATGITLSLSGSQSNYSVSGITNYGDTWTEHAGLKYGNTCYAGNGETVSLTLGTTRQGYIVSYSVNAGTLSSSSGSIYNLAMPNADVTISANYSPDPNHFSANNAKTEYTIKTATGWGVFCDALQDNDTYNRFSGKTVKLDADISISTMAGSSKHDFCGTFDGQSHTLTFNYGSNDAYANEQYIAPFRYVVGVSEEVPATIKNLHIVGDIYTKQPYAAGLVAQMWGTVRITNCRISTAIHSSVSGDGSHGGLVSVQQNGGLEIEGCVFNGKLLGSSTSCCGGFVGWRKSGAEIRNSLFAPTEVTIDNANSATFSRNKIDTYNSYYTYLLNDGTNYPPYLNDGTTSPRKFNNGQQARKITAGNFVTLAFRGTTTQYNVSGITSSTVGLKYNNVFYAASGDQVSLSLSNTVPANYEVSGYSVSPAGATLTLTVTVRRRAVAATISSMAQRPPLLQVGMWLKAMSASTIK